MLIAAKAFASTQTDPHTTVRECVCVCIVTTPWELCQGSCDVCEWVACGVRVSSV